MAHSRIVKMIPIFVIALLAQLHAPVGSSLAIGRVAKSGVTDARPCPMHAHSAPAQTGAPHSPGAVCDLCEFTFCGVAAVAFAVPTLPVHRAFARRIVWMLPAGLIFGGRREAIAQARAPPSAG